MKQARKLDWALVAKACSSFRARIQGFIDAEGDGLNKQNVHIGTSILMSKLLN
ncbi:Hypothetical protein FKW44_022466 [Caligus rogercresseyi]|uniref:Uncharacterized protein n=1 Tax=Caligus rogercresseyi TaxID=217165 RepID=A0A7T8GNG3_CALRO|nr:Hypothetical protein FKW44_022466 [Caligus rogercresseyi]